MTLDEFGRAMTMRPRTRGADGVERVSGFEEFDEETIRGGVRVGQYLICRDVVGDISVYVNENVPLTAEVPEGVHAVVAMMHPYKLWQVQYAPAHYFEEEPE